MIKDAIDMYEQKVWEEKASPSKISKMQRGLWEQIQNAIEKLTKS